MDTSSFDDFYQDYEQSLITITKDSNEYWGVYFATQISKQDAAEKVKKGNSESYNILVKARNPENGKYYWFYFCNVWCGLDADYLASSFIVSCYDLSLIVLAGIDSCFELTKDGEQEENFWKRMIYNKTSETKGWYNNEKAENPYLIAKYFLGSDSLDRTDLKRYGSTWAPYGKSIKSSFQEKEVGTDEGNYRTIWSDGQGVYRWAICSKNVNSKNYILCLIIDNTPYYYLLPRLETFQYRLENKNSYFDWDVLEIKEGYEDWVSGLWSFALSDESSKGKWWEQYCGNKIYISNDTHIKVYNFQQNNNNTLQQIINFLIGIKKFMRIKIILLID